MEKYSDFDLDDPGLVSMLDDMPAWSAPFGLRLLETVVCRRGMTVLDLGTGTGFPLTVLAARLGGGCRAIGIDPWRRAALRCRDRIRKTGLDTAAVVLGRGEEMPFPDRCFDCIVSNNGLNNVDDRDQTIGECARVARPGAQLVLTENLPETMAVFYDLFRETVLDLGIEGAVAGIDAHIGRHRRPAEETAERLEAAGFAVRECRRDRFDMRYADGSAFFGDFFIRLAFAGPWRAVVPVERREAVFAELERRLNGLAGRRGELAVGVPFVCIDARRR